MKRILLPLLVSICCFSEINSQETTSQNDVNTLEDQFYNIIKKSNSYEDYKVVKKYKLNQLQKSVLDSVVVLKTKIETFSEEITTYQQQIAGLNDSLSTTNNALLVSKEKENGIYLFGMLLQKSTYNIILWSIIGTLLFLFGVFVMKFRRSNSITGNATLKLSESEEEFGAFRQRSLEREQQLRRKLQDELNKNK